MKFTTFTLFSASAILAPVTAVPSSDATYKLKVGSTNPELKDGVLTLKDESPSNTSPNALGIFSSGEPRTPYTFTFGPSSASSKLYDIERSVRQTHLIVSGNPIAMNLLDVPMGTNPKLGANETQYTGRWLLWESNGKTELRLAEGLEGTMVGAGSWRACKGNSERDYELYWFDGLHALQEVVKGCESVSLYIEEEKAGGSTSGGPFITGVPAPSETGSGFITGVPAPTGTFSGFITGVPAPSATGTFLPGATGGNKTNTSATPTPASFEGAGQRVVVPGTVLAAVLGAAAWLL